ncbi:MAG TPA: DUF4363 family protein [Firmicutes bacterium]|nr:DUF4363 family protein [Bacillota bacterium]
MKMVWVAIGVIVLISASAIGLYMYSVSLHHQLHESLKKIERAAEADNWEEVQQITKKLEKSWGIADATWSPVMDRRDVDRVDEAITRVAHLAGRRQKEELLLEVSIAKRFVVRLMQKESLSIRSVF